MRAFREALVAVALTATATARSPSPPRAPAGACAFARNGWSRRSDTRVGLFLLSDNVVELLRENVQRLAVQSLLFGRRVPGTDTP